MAGPASERPTATAARKILAGPRPSRAFGAAVRLLLAHPHATHKGSVAGARRDGPGVVQARPVPVARVRADVPVRPRVRAGKNAATGRGAHVPLGVLAGRRTVATVL